MGPLSLELTVTKVYEPEERAHLGVILDFKPTLQTSNAFRE